MSNELNLSLPPRKKRGGVPSSLRAIFLAAIVVVILGIAAVAVLLSLKVGGADEGLGPTELRELALRLEGSDLRVAAAEAWIEYLAAAKPDGEERAAIWYRIGKLREETFDFESAVEAYFRSEAWHASDELSFDIGRRVEENLERLGKFSGRRRELDARVGTETGGEIVVAEIGPTKITGSDLDRRIESLISDQLAAYSSILSAEELNREKENLFKRYATEDQRAALLGQYLAEELLYRHSRSAGLGDDAEVRDRIIRSERGILAQAALQREISERIHITPVDVESFYSANKESYRTVERVRIGHILSDTLTEAEGLLRRAESGADFAVLAREASLDTTTADNGGDLGWVEKGDRIPGIGSSADVAGLILATESGAVVAEVLESETGFHVVKVLEREPPRQRSFEEVRSTVFEDLYGRKSTEVQEQLLEQLRIEYDVVIHQSALAGTQEGEPAEDGKR